MGFLEQLTRLVKPEVQTPSQALTHRVVLGALLSLVSHADGKVTTGELSAQKAVLAKRGFTQPEEQTEIFLAAQRALEERLDWEGFTREINQRFEYSERVQLIQDLFSVAWADHVLDPSEVETVRKLANLLWLDPKDFIQAKLTEKPESRP